MVLGSDGLFDNLFDHELAATVTVRSGPYNSIGVSARCYRGLQFNWGFSKVSTRSLHFNMGFMRFNKGKSLSRVKGK